MGESCNVSAKGRAVSGRTVPALCQSPHHLGQMAVNEYDLDKELKQAEIGFFQDLDLAVVL